MILDQEDEVKPRYLEEVIRFSDLEFLTLLQVFVL